MVRRLGLGKNNHLTYASLALNPRYVIFILDKKEKVKNAKKKKNFLNFVCLNVSSIMDILSTSGVGFYQGPVVQSVVSLTSSLRVISLTVLADLIHSILIFFAEKMWVAFALQKLLTFFQQKISAYLHITRCKF